jgi:hypothetical protein
MYVYVCGVSKKFSEWYQKTNETEDTNKLTLLVIILKANKVNLFISSVLFVFWYHSPNVLDTSRMCMYVYMYIIHSCHLNSGLLHITTIFNSSTKGLV